MLMLEWLLNAMVCSAFMRFFKTQYSLMGTIRIFSFRKGKLNTEQLQMLLEFLIAAESSSLRAVETVACCLFVLPVNCISLLLRPYPDALLLL